MKIKIIYNSASIDSLELFNKKISQLKEDYKNDFTIEESDNIKFNFLINNKLVYTLDDHFSNDAVLTATLIDKIDQQIYQVKSTRKERDSSKFDDLGLIDY